MLLQIKKFTQMCGTAEEEDVVDIDTRVEDSPNYLLSNVVLVGSLSYKVVEKQSVERLKDYVDFMRF